MRRPCMILMRRPCMILMQAGKASLLGLLGGPDDGQAGRVPASERFGPAYAAMMSMTSHRDRGLPPTTRGYCSTVSETTVASMDLVVITAG